MNRRLFIAGSVGTLAAAQVPSAKSLVVGVIGAGFRGLQLIRSLLEQPAVRIGAICETYEPRMFGAGAITRAKGHRTRYYRIYRDLIADGDLDAVVVATPDFSHHTMVLEALKAGKHVYVEQPLCLSWEQGVDLLNAEREASRVVQVGSQRRSSPVFVEAARQISAGALGRVRAVDAVRTSRALRPEVLKRGGVKLPEPWNFVDWQAGVASKVPLSVDRFWNWRYYPEYGGGVVADLGVHVLDGIQMLTGDEMPLIVKASGTHATLEGLDTPEQAAIVVEYASGKLVTLSLDAAAITPAHELVSIECGNGRCELTPSKAMGWKGSLPAPAWQRSVMNGDEVATNAHIADFLDAIRLKKKASAPASAAFAATLVCQMANIAIRTGRSVRWNAADQNISLL